MTFEESAAGFVLAGGRSTRMGRDKALLPLGDRPLVQRALDKLLSIDPKARIAGGRSELSAFAPVVSDLHPGCGPLSGLEAALAASEQPLNIFLPVDLPLVPVEFLRWLLQRARITGAQATIPRVCGLAQPLCSVYRRSLLAPVTAALAAGQYKVMPVVRAPAGPASVDLFDVEVIASASRDWAGFSPLPVHLWFRNCNSPEDMAAVEDALVWMP